MMEGDSNFSCLTYENVLSKEDSWTANEQVWLLGRKYSLPSETTQFIEASRTKFWFTYRKCFSPIGGTGPTSDSGWGCMLRCGQMMLAETLRKLRMKDDWKWRPGELQNEEYYMILEQFVDKRSSCYSIQQIAQMGVQEGKSVGEWFGPNTVAQVMKKLSAFDDQNHLAIYVAMDNTVCVQDVEELCITKLARNFKTTFKNDGAVHHASVSTKETETWSENCEEFREIWKPLVIFIPLRLGLSEINSVYFENIRQCFTWNESVGIIGGKPNHAYYFIGCTNTNSLVFLDPHTTQTSAPEDENKIDFSHDKSYHCEIPSKMPISLLDPSLALGFLCKTKTEFQEFCTRVKTQKNNRESLQLFAVVDCKPSCNLMPSRVVSVSVHNRDKLRSGSDPVDDGACLFLDSDESLDDIDEEFEILEIAD